MSSDAESGFELRRKKKKNRGPSSEGGPSENLDTESEKLTHFQSLGLKGLMCTPDTTEGNKTYVNLMFF